MSEIVAGLVQSFDRVMESPDYYYHDRSFSFRKPFGQTREGSWMHPLILGLGRPRDLLFGCEPGGQLTPDRVDDAQPRHRDPELRNGQGARVTVSGVRGQ
jgi:hypothetical protein